MCRLPREAHTRVDSPPPYKAWVTESNRVDRQMQLTEPRCTLPLGLRDGKRYTSLFNVHVYVFIVPFNFQCLRKDINCRS